MTAPESSSYKYKNYTQVLWVFSTFKDWASEQGIQLDDENLRYIADMLITFPSDIRKKIAHEYVHVYLQALKEEGKPKFARHGDARRRANTWIRENKHAFSGDLEWGE